MLLVVLTRFEDKWQSVEVAALTGSDVDTGDKGVAFALFLWEVSSEFVTPSFFEICSSFTIDG